MVAVILMGEARAALSACPALSFAPVSPSFQISSAGQLLVRDVNGDGIPDLVIPPANGDAIGVAIGKGDGTFEPPVLYGHGGLNSTPMELFLSDVDGDGHLDVIATSSDPTVGTLVYLGHGDGTFALPTSYPYQSVMVGDVNGDGLPDFVYVNSPKVFVVLNLGHGVFGSPIEGAVLPGAAAVGLGDFDGDGRSDLWYSLNQSGGTFRSNGDGTFARGQSFPSFAPRAAADLNRDGRADLVGVEYFDYFGEGEAVFYGSSDGTFTSASTAALPPSVALGTPVVGDFDGDGSIDVLSPGVYSSGGIGVSAIFLGGVGPALSAPLFFPFGFGDAGPIVAAADLNGDGLADIVTASGFVFLAHRDAEGSVDMPDGFLDQPYDSQASARIEPMIASYSLVAGQLPPGLTLGSTGEVSGQPTQPGTFDFTVSVGVGACVSQRRCHIVVLSSFPVPIITGATPECVTGTGTVEIDGSGFLASSRVTANGAPVPTTFVSHSRLLALVDLTTSLESPIALIVSNYNVADVVASSSNTFSIHADPEALVPSLLPDAGLGSAYRQPLDVLSPSGIEQGGYTFSLASGQLPPGLSMGSDGLIAGKPSTVGTFSFSVAAVNGACELENAYSVNVVPTEAVEACPVRWIAAERARLPDVGATALKVVIADFNRDGIPDIATLPSAGTCVSILLGTRDGGFEPPYCVYPSDLSTMDFEALDLNGDGIPDLVAGRSILLGVGDGSFQSAGTISIPGGNGRTEFGDFNGDSRLDYAVVDGSALVAYISDAQGHYHSSTVLQLNVVGAITGAAVADFNHDGLADIAVSLHLEGLSGDRIAVFFGRTTGTFERGVDTVLPGPFSVLRAADLDGDSNPDLILRFYENTVPHFPTFLGNGDGTFRAGSELPTDDFELGDLNGDGKPDMIYADQGGTRIALGRGDGSFVAQPELYGGIAKAVFDVDGDGHRDVLLSGANRNEVLIARGNGDGTLRAARVFGSPSVQRVMLAGDFNEDGRADFFVAPNVLFLGDGRGGFVSKSIASISDADVGSAAVGDFDGDGHLDIAFLGDVPDSFQIASGNGDGTFRSPEAVPLDPPGGESLIVADLNGDGRPDLIVGGQTLEVFLNRGHGRFVPAARIDVPSSVMVAADFNGDGHTDLAVFGPNANGQQPYVQILLGHGDGTFDPPVPVIAESTPGASLVLLYMLAADLDGDGIPDLFIANPAAYGILHGNGDGTFHAGLQHRTTDDIATFEAAALGDFNGDGAPDIALAGQGLLLLINRGGGVFDPDTSLASNKAAIALAVGDLDGRGHDSLAVLDSLVWVFPNDTVAPLVQPDSLPAGHVGVSYGSSVSETGGQPPSTFRVSTGHLPPGLSLEGGAGTISGVPTSAGRFAFTVTATDAGECTGSRRYSIVINADPTGRRVIAPPTTPAEKVVRPWR